MRASIALMVAAAVAAACSASVERIEVALPSAGPAVLAVQRADRVRAWAVDASTPLETLDPIADWDGEPISLAWVAVDLAALELRVGPLDAPEPTRALSEAVMAPRTFARRLEGDVDSGWTKPDRLPDFLAAVRIPDVSPCARIRGTATRTASTTVTISAVALLPAVGGVARALVGLEREDDPLAQGGLGVVTATDALVRAPSLAWPDVAPHALAWDGRQTVWATLVRAFTGEHRVVAVGLDGRERWSARVPREPFEELMLARRWDDTVVAYSPHRVLELSTTSTRPVDRTADYPRGLVALLELSPERRYAIAPEGVLHHFEGGAWRVESRELAGAVRLYAFDGGPVALADVRLYVRGAAGTWAALEDPFPTINKLDVADLGGGRMLVGGGAGLVASYSAARGWCTAATGHTRYVHSLQARGADAVAFEYLGDDPVNLPSVLFWYRL